MIIKGECVAQMALLEECSVDAIVTDPPYGINFMGKAWDAKAIVEAANKPRDLEGLNRYTGSPDSPNARKSIARTKSGFQNHAGEAGAYDFTIKGNHAFQAWTEAWAREAYRVLKPGGYLLSFCGTRTYHRMASGVEDAGFEIRDCVAWMYGSGFPKSMDVAYAIDKSLGVERTDRESAPPGANKVFKPSIAILDAGAPVTAAAAAWEGWGTALKPAFEPIVVARKPFKGTVAANVLEHGTGALNIEAGRLDARGAAQTQGSYRGSTVEDVPQRDGGKTYEADLGRWPSNVMFDEDAAALLGEPARFFYVAKASRSERNAGLADFDQEGVAVASGPGGWTADRRPRANVHPTVKPIDLMRQLVRLVCRKGGVVLDPFNGSGTTGCACVLEGMDYIGIDRDDDGTYIPIAEARIAFWQEHGEDGWRIVRERDAAEAKRERHTAAGQLDIYKALEEIT